MFTASGGEIGFRKLSESDVNDIEILYKECFPVCYPYSWYTDLVSNPNVFSFAAVFSDIVIGIIVFKFLTVRECSDRDQLILDLSFPVDSTVAYISSLGVRESFRSHGVASQLLSAFLHCVSGVTYRNEVDHSMIDSAYQSDLSVADYAIRSPSASVRSTNLFSPDLHLDLVHLIHELPRQPKVCRAVYLHVLISNKSARQFYEHRGFRLAHMQPRCYTINGRLADGCTYVFYCNGGYPPVFSQDYSKPSSLYTVYDNDSTIKDHRPQQPLSPWLPTPIAWLFHSVARLSRALVDRISLPGATTTSIRSRDANRKENSPDYQRDMWPSYTAVRR